MRRTAVRLPSSNVDVVASMRVSLGLRPYARSRASMAFSSTLAPLTQSWGVVYSSREWLIPLTLGTKIMPAWVMLAMAWASCPAPLGMTVDSRPRSRAALATTP